MHSVSPQPFIYFGHAWPCGILVPWVGIELSALAVKVQSPNHWTTMELSKLINYSKQMYS